MEIKKSLINDIIELFKENTERLSSPYDSFLEEHIFKSSVYLITIEGERAGYFSIYNEETMTQFYLRDKYKHFGQELFMQARKYESVKNAFVPTCDEFYLSSALDNYLQIEKQAYFFLDRNHGKTEEFERRLEYRKADNKDIELIKRITSDFFSDPEGDMQRGELYIFYLNGTEAGVGIAEKSKLIERIESIGMYVVPEYRRAGIGTEILLTLKNAVKTRNGKVAAGCWYYNHQSKKTLEKAGMYTGTRLLKISY